MKKLLILAGLAAAAAGVARILASGSVTTEDGLEPAYVGEPADKSEDVSAFDDDRDDTGGTDDSGDRDTGRADEAAAD